MLDDPHTAHSAHTHTYELLALREVCVSLHHLRDYYFFFRRVLLVHTSFITFFATSHLSLCFPQNHFFFSWLNLCRVFFSLRYNWVFFASTCLREAANFANQLTFWFFATETRPHGTHNSSNNIYKMESDCSLWHLCTGGCTTSPPSLLGSLSSGQSTIRLAPPAAAARRPDRFPCRMFHETRRPRRRPTNKTHRWNRPVPAICTHYWTFWHLVGVPSRRVFQAVIFQALFIANHFTFQL